MAFTLKRAGVLAGFIAVCEAAGIAGGIVTSRSIPQWYAALNKPSFNPPNTVFGPVWIVLYALMGIAAYMIWDSADTRKRRTALKAFTVQLVLNMAWTLLFFGLRSPKAAFIEIIALWIAIAVTLILFSRISVKAALLLIPYLAWTTFASVLNWSLWRLNR